MPLNLPRICHVLRRTLAGGARDVWAGCERQWTIWPAAAARVAPALYPEGALEKIHGLSPWRTWAREEPLIHGGALTLGPTRACLLRDVDIVEGHLYSGATLAVEGIGEPGLWPASAREPDIAQGHLVSTYSGTLFFGCLLLDDFLLELLSPDPGANLSLTSKPSGHEGGYRDLLGLGPKRTVAHARVRELTYYEDPAFNASKAERYRRLRARLRRAAHGVIAPRADLLYIRRGLSGERRVLANEPALEAALQRRGFTVLDPIGMPVDDIVRHSLGARVVVSIEGSQISHTIFSMADDAALVVLQPPDRFGLQYKEFADCLDMPFGFVVCDPGEQGFVVDIDALQRLLDRLAP